MAGAWAASGIVAGTVANKTGSLVSPSSLAQAFEHVGVVFRAHPWHALADIPLEQGRHNRYGLLQRFLCLFGPAELAERGSEPTVRVRKIGV